jgi:hypothetical protein
MGSRAGQTDILKIPKARHTRANAVDFLGVVADELA